MTLCDVSCIDVFSDGVWQGSKRPRSNQKHEPGSPNFSPYQHPASPQPPHAHGHGHGHSHALQPPSTGATGNSLNGTATTSTIGPTISGSSTSDELLFFDRTKKLLENSGTYDSFLKLLSLFSKDIIDTPTLLSSAEVFLGDGELMVQFREMVSWDVRVATAELGPPGSIRTSAPDTYAARLPDDGQGPSYRRLHETVSCSVSFSFLLSLSLDVGD